MPYPPPPRQRSFTRTVFTTLAGTIFSISLLLNIYLLLFSGIGGLVGGDSGTVETVLQEGDRTQQVIVLPIEGMMTDETAKQLDKWLDRIEENQHVRAVVLAVDTPGGAVTAADRIYHRLEQFRQRKGVNIVVSMGGVAASGGYYVSCHADRIFVQETTLTGSIGVMMPYYNLSGLAQRYGVEDKTITAPPQGLKNAGSMLRPEDPREREYLQRLIDSAYQRFTKLVREGRTGKLKGSETELFDGRALTAQQALDAGLVDAKGYLEDACAWAAQQAGLGKPMIVQYHRRVSGLEMLLSSSGVARPEASGGRDITLRIDSRLLDELATPRLMYLWRGQ